MLNKKGQFSIIAALLVSVILVAAVIVTYSSIRTDQFASQPQVLSAIDATNLAIKQVLGFTLGYYGSILQVTGNQSYANSMASQYLQSGFANIGNTNPQWGASFNVTNSAFHLNWFSNSSYSEGNVTVKYSLNGLGIQGITYTASCELGAKIMNSTGNQARINIIQDQNQSIVNLGQSNFKFYQYSLTNSSWKQIYPNSEPTSFANGTYLVNVPSGVDPYSFLVQIQDSRGIIVVASSFNHYSLLLNWNSTIYNSACLGSILSVELLQNGTARWLGQNLQATGNTKPLPPVPVKSIRINETISGINRQVPFQIEDWASNFKVPLGLTNNASVFGNRNMLVFLINPNVTRATIWWDGSDTAKQTSYAYANRYFQGDNHANHILNNTKLLLTFSFGSGTVTAQDIGGTTTTSTAQFVRINNQWSIYGSQEAYTISDGIVRDIVLVESEWDNQQPDGTNGGATGCPNIYCLTVFTLPANVTYYTYQTRITFLNSTKPRTISDLCLASITCTTTNTAPQTENGTQGGYPQISTKTTLFYNYSKAYSAHHWSQINSTSNGVGVTFPSNSNNELYVFDSATNKVGGLNVAANSIQVKPVGQGSVSFTYPIDTIWYGAVDTFNTKARQVYSTVSGSKAGLWVTTEYPPAYSISTSG